jgi:hypothetical protein
MPKAPITMKTSPMVAQTFSQRFIGAPLALLERVLN